MWMVAPRSQRFGTPTLFVRFEGGPFRFANCQRRSLCKASSSPMQVGGIGGCVLANDNIVLRVLRFQLCHFVE